MCSIMLPSVESEKRNASQREEQKKVLDHAFQRMEHLSFVDISQSLTGHQYIAATTYSSLADLAVK